MILRQVADDHIKKKELVMISAVVDSGEAKFTHPKHESEITTRETHVGHY